MKYDRPQFAVGFSFDQESYGKLSEQLSGIGVDFLDVIGLNLEVICRNVVTVRSLETVPYIANEVIIIIIIIIIIMIILFITYIALNNPLINFRSILLALWGHVVPNRRAGIRQYTPSVSIFSLRFFSGKKA